MDIEEFSKTVPPGKKKSRLNKYENEIKLLKSKSYTDDQVREWLSKNGLNVSREAVRQFVKKNTESQTTSNHEQTKNKDNETLNANESHVEKLRRRLAEQESDAYKTHFKHDKSGSIIWMVKDNLSLMRPSARHAPPHKHGRKEVTNGAKVASDIEALL